MRCGDWLNGNRLHVNGFADEAEAMAWAQGDRQEWLGRVHIPKRD